MPPSPPAACPGWGGVNATLVFSPMKSSKISPQEGESTVGPRRGSRIADNLIRFRIPGAKTDFKLFLKTITLSLAYSIWSDFTSKYCRSRWMVKQLVTLDRKIFVTACFSFRDSLVPISQSVKWNNFIFWAQKHLSAHVTRTLAFQGLEPGKMLFIIWFNLA